MWGVVYQSSNGAGFALEFIGDMHDSSAAGTESGYCGTNGVCSGLTAVSQGLGLSVLQPALDFTKALNGHAGAGRGIN